MTEQRRLLGATPFFTGLTQHQVHEIASSFRQASYREGDFIQLAGDLADRLSIVAVGMVKMARPTVDGQDVLLGFLGPGEHFGSLATLGDRTYRETITAQTHCCILHASARAFQDLLQRYPAVALSTLDLVAARLRDAQATIEQISAYPIDHRVASTLLHLADRIGRTEGPGTLIEMPLSRQDIADMTGATVETVSRVMSEFRRSGLIDSGRRWISVLNRDALAEIAAHDPS